MGMMKRIYQEMQEREARNTYSTRELEEMALDFETMDLQDGDWWRQQDAEMTRREREEIEALAEIQDYRINGYGL